MGMLETGFEHTTVYDQHYQCVLKETITKMLQSKQFQIQTQIYNQTALHQGFPSPPLFFL